MNASGLPPVGLTTMPDVQGSVDVRNLPIERVGVRGVRYPVLLDLGLAEIQPSIADFSLSVALPADQKGTHMSRFIALLEQMSREGRALGPASIGEMAVEMLELLHGEEGTIELTAPMFIRKTAPISGVSSLMDYSVGFTAEVVGGQPVVQMSVSVPVKSLCPCSKEISDYGAHNQRSMVTVKVGLGLEAELTALKLIQAIESQASCELWGLLKRPDEKYVTERAYDNAKFVEDLVRDVAIAVRALPGVLAFEVDAENFESIHNHSAWARVRGTV